MARVSQLQYRADMVVEFYKAHGCDSSLTCAHFQSQAIPRSTIYRIIKRYKETGECKFRAITGRPRSKTTPQLCDKIDKALGAKPTASVRELAAKFNVSPTTVTRVKKQIGYRSFRARPAPKLINNQEQRIISGSTKIYKQLVPSGGSKVLVIDDETYVPQDPEQVPGLHFYSQKNGSPVDDAVRFRGKTKFFKKFCVWQAIDQLGNVSAPYITTGTICSEIYLEECLKKRLLPFILRHHSSDQVLFWPDLARPHYAKIVTEWLQRTGIEFVAAHHNPPNFPHCRPIEKFWALCKTEYAKRARVTKSLASFRRIWSNISDRVAERSGKNLMEGIKTKLRSVRDGGALAPLKVKLPLANITLNNPQQ